ncbi:hypothetical protein ABID14_000679 [Peptoniphilus olsenii]|uniref:cAMP factor (Cfa) n=1 Tax=Peptoniphilus olsenii TaxID=411570 RepID=A0ABV2J9W0_9FIRM
MKKIKKIMAFILAVSIFASSTTTVFANELIDDADPVEEKLEIDDVAVYKQKIKNIRSDVNNVVAKDDEEKKLIEEFNQKADELESGIDASVKAEERKINSEDLQTTEGSLEIDPNVNIENQEGIGFANIYDLSTIPTRVEVLIRMGRAIRFATTELRYKVDAAHVEIGEYIAVGLLHAVNPFSTSADMKAYIAEFDALRDKLLSYPDMALNDTANLYVRSDLDEKLHKARFLKYNELKDRPTHVIEKLDREVSEVTRLRLRPQATLAEIYQLSDRLDQAVSEALSSEDRKATKSEISRVKELRREMRKARRMGDERQEVAQVIDRVDEEMLLTRPSQINVRGLIKTMEALMY